MRTMLILYLLASTGCAQLPPALPDEPPLSPAECPIISSRDWAAWIENNAGRQWLTVTGRATVPTGGYALSLALGPTREIDPPSQDVELIVQPPSGPATQVVTEQEVVGRFPALPAYSEVVITCGGRTIGRVSPVSTVIG